MTEVEEDFAEVVEVAFFEDVDDVDVVFLVDVTMLVFAVDVEVVFLVEVEEVVVFFVVEVVLDFTARSTSGRDMEAIFDETGTWWALDSGTISCSSPCSVGAAQAADKSRKRLTIVPLIFATD